MRILQPFNVRRRRGSSGWTLVEILVATGIGSIVMGSMMVVLLFSSRSFIAIANYGILNQSSRFALDTLNRDIRNGQGITAGSAVYLVMTNQVGDKFSYVYNSTNSTLTRNFTNSAGTVTISVLLTNCDVFAFTYYKKIPTNPPAGLYAPYFVTTATAQDAKLINVDWRCFRPIMGAKQNTESVQTAQITIRN